MSSWADLLSSVYLTLPTIAPSDWEERSIYMSIDPDSAPRGLKPKDFAKTYGLSERHVYDQIRQGKLPVVTVGNRYVILVQKFEEMAQTESGGDQNDDVQQLPE